MDLFQNTVKEKSFGRPFAVGCRATLSKTNDLIVTGTVYTASPNNDNKTPSGIYFHKERWENANALPGKPAFCDAISLSPNPFIGSFKVLAGNFDLTYLSTVSVFNELGQKVLSYTLDCQASNCDLSKFPRGMYTVVFTDKEESCAIKALNY
jgi:hypothetical protein